MIILYLLRKLRPKKVCYQIYCKKLQISTIFQLAVSKILCKICAIKMNMFFITVLFTVRNEADKNSSIVDAQMVKTLH